MCRVGLTAPGGYRENPECLGNFAVFREIGVSHDPGRDFGSRRHAQPIHDPLDVRFDRPGREDQALRDVLVGKALGDERRNLLFATA